MWLIILVTFLLQASGYINTYRFDKLYSSQFRIFGGKVALTRELGKNDKLKSLLPDSVETYELPCIMFDAGRDLNRLQAEMSLHDIIIITSPQSASIFIEQWQAKGCPVIQVATVGKGTSKPLLDVGINVIFEPSDSTAVVLAQELPISYGSSVLYPTSNLADNKLQDGLESRDFQVTRLETYATVPSIWSDEDLNIAKNNIDIVALGR